MGLMFSGIGRLLIIAGSFILLTGILLVLFDKIPFLGKLPGDLTFKGKNYTVFFPLATSLVLSLILTLILNLFGKK